MWRPSDSASNTQGAPLRWPLLILLLAILSLFALQPNRPGFQPGHNGWVASHGLAIISHATPNKGLHGYSLQFEDPNGQRHYEYFDRYPVLFSGLMHQVISWGQPKPSEQILRAGFVMNVIFAATLCAAFALLLQLGMDGWGSVATTLLAFSSPFWISFKDVIHFDQPAILGALLLLNGIAHHYRTGTSTFLWGTVVLAMSLGRSYSSILILGLWTVLQTLQTLSASNKLPFRSLFSQISVQTLAAGVLVSTVHLGYNITHEASVRNVPLSETSILVSAESRLGRNDLFNAQHEQQLAWSEFLSELASRTLANLFPYPLGFKLQRLLHTEWRAALWPAISLLAVLLLYGLFKTSAHTRTLWLILGASGLLWLLLMRNLAAFHPYTTIYAYGFGLAFWALIVSATNSRFRLFLSACSLVIFVGIHVLANRYAGYESEQPSRSVADFEAIRLALPSGAAVAVQGGHKILIPGNPYALGFPLPDNPIGKLGHTPFILSTIRLSEKPLLTPCNQNVFLYGESTGLVQRVERACRSRPATKP